MGTVTIKFPPAPDQVRTARALAVTVARRAGVSDHLLDEVRLAVGEACARAVHAHLAAGVSAPISLVLSDGDPGGLDGGGLDGGGFEAEVVDLASTPPSRSPGRRGSRAGLAAAFGSEDAAAIGLGILGAVVDEVSIEPVSPLGTRVRMRWPVRIPA
jgi:anti-sigma regulatory factor (Ser/Thr protein kinase)